MTEANSDRCVITMLDHQVGDDVAAADPVDAPLQLHGRAAGLAHRRTDEIGVLVAARAAHLERHVLELGKPVGIDLDQIGFQKPGELLLLCRRCLPPVAAQHELRQLAHVEPLVQKLTELLLALRLRNGGIGQNGHSVGGEPADEAGGIRLRVRPAGRHDGDNHDGGYVEETADRCDHCCTCSLRVTASAERRASS